MKMHVSSVAGNLAHHIYTCSPWLDQRDAFLTFFLSVSVVGQMERVLKDDAIQEKGERARMVTTPFPSDLLVFLLGLTRSTCSSVGSMALLQLCAISLY